MLQIMPKYNIVHFRPWFKFMSFVHCLFIIWLFIYQWVIVRRSILSVTPSKWLCLMLIVASERKIPPQSTQNQMMGHVLIAAYRCVGKRHFTPATRGREDYRSRDDKVVRLEGVALTTR
jgi:hypothetical protein